METGMLGEIGIGACLGLSAIGSALGIRAAGMAAIGAWKKCYIQNKPVPFILVAFAGAPLTQTIYGFILMNALAASQALNGFQLLGLGIFAGIAIGLSSYAQGSCAATASDAYAETEQGFGNFILIIGLCETVALFVMVFGRLIA
jgi:V/A-type H+-transporting ATPase subunit K